MFFVRTASDRDMSFVRDILIDTYHATYDKLLGVAQVNEICSEFHTIEKLSEKRHIPQSEFLVGDNGDVVGGMAYATQQDKNIMLHQLYVLPQYQGGKTGLHLLIEIENSFIDAETISLEVLKENQKAISFYEKYGFNKTGEVRNDCGGMKNAPCYVMRKNITYAED